MDAGTGGHHQGQQDPIGAGSVGQSYLHGIEMTSHVGGVDVCYGNIEASAGAAYFFRRGDDCFRAAKNLAHGVASGDVPQSAMLEFSSCADDGALAVAFDDFRVSAERGDEGARHFQTEWLQVIHESGDLLHIRAREGILDDGQRGCTAQWDGGEGAAFMKYFLDGRRLFSNSNLRHA